MYCDRCAQRLITGTVGVQRGFLMSIVLALELKLTRPTLIDATIPAVNSATKVPVKTPRSLLPCLARASLRRSSAQNVS